MGSGALQANTTASQNTAVGYQALYSSNRTADISAGNTAVGESAAYNSTTGQRNACFGQRAGFPLSTGSYNTLLGWYAGNGSVNLDTGSYNILIGAGANVNAGSDTNEIAIGNNNSTGGITGKGSNTAYISANGGGTYNGANSTLWAITSDQRLKKNIVDNTVGLDAITKIQVRNFEYRTADEITDLPKSSAIDIKGVQLGPIAQELAQILPDCVKTESTGVMSVDASNITWYLVNAIKELKAEIDQLKSK